MNFIQQTNEPTDTKWMTQTRTTPRHIWTPSPAITDFHTTNQQTINQPIARYKSNKKRIKQW